MPEFAGRGDPRRTMELLWGRTPPASRGPAAGLSPSDVVRAAIAVADADGFAGLTMRRIAERLGRSPMSLYTYVPGKAELIDLMLDRAYGEVLAAITSEGDWRAALESRARGDWAGYERHPWGGRGARPPPVLRPHQLAGHQAAPPAGARVLTGGATIDASKPA